MTEKMWSLSGFVVAISVLPLFLSDVNFLSPVSVPAFDLLLEIVLKFRFVLTMIALELFAILMNLHVWFNLLLADFHMANRASDFQMNTAFVLTQLDFGMERFFASFAFDCFLSVSVNISFMTFQTYRDYVRLAALLAFELPFARCCRTSYWSWSLSRSSKSTKSSRYVESYTSFLSKWYPTMCDLRICFLLVE